MLWRAICSLYIFGFALKHCLHLFCSLLSANTANSWSDKIQYSTLDMRVQNLSFGLSVISKLKASTGMLNSIQISYAKNGTRITLVTKYSLKNCCQLENRWDLNLIILLWLGTVIYRKNRLQHLIIGTLMEYSMCHVNFSTPLQIH